MVALLMVLLAQCAQINTQVGIGRIKSKIPPDHKIMIMKLKDSCKCGYSWTAFEKGKEFKSKFCPSCGAVL
jgi:hypothetical protein